MALQDDWSVDFDILTDNIKNYILKKEKIQGTEFSEPEIISMYNRKIYNVAKQIVGLYEKNNNIWTVE